MAKQQPTPSADPPPPSKPDLAQQIANATGLGTLWITERLDAADAWDVATELLMMGDAAEIAALLNPCNKAT
jgi:hypothetical protein